MNAFEEKLMALECGEVFTINDRVCYIAVPGGWLYCTGADANIHGVSCSISNSVCFIPRPVTDWKAMGVLAGKNAILRGALEAIRMDAHTNMEGAGMPEFKNYEDLAAIARKGLTDGSI